MEARIFPKGVPAAAGRILSALLLVALLVCSMGARARSRNFVVETSDPTLARQIAQAAEKYRRDLAVSWIGKAMPDWSAPCLMTVRVAPNLGAGGSTTFMFDHGEVFGWRMSIQGSRERIFDSVLPHEVTHMILASHFRRPLPRWADEGAATSTECASERKKHYRMLKEFLCTRRGIAFNQMFAMTEYPHDVMPLYAQGFSVVDYLIQQGGRRKFVAFLEDALESGRWASATRRHYGISSLGRLQNRWLDWIRQGHPSLEPGRGDPETSSEILLADASGRAGRGSGRSSDSTAPSRSVRVPGRQLAATGRRPWPEPNLIYRIPRGEAAPAKAWQAPPGAAAAPIRSQTARPQPVEQARQIILEWSKPGVVGAPVAGGQGRY